MRRREEEEGKIRKEQKEGKITGRKGGNLIGLRCVKKFSFHYT